MTRHVCRLRAHVMIYRWLKFKTLFYIMQFAKPRTKNQFSALILTDSTIAKIQQSLLEATNCIFIGPHHTVEYEPKKCNSYLNIDYIVLSKVGFGSGLNASWKRIFFIFCQIFDDFSKWSTPKLLRNFEESSKLAKQLHS